MAISYVLLHVFVVFLCWALLAMNGFIEEYSVFPASTQLKMQVKAKEGQIYLE